MKETRILRFWRGLRSKRSVLILLVGIIAIGLFRWMHTAERQVVVVQPASVSIQELPAYATAGGGADQQHWVQRQEECGESPDFLEGLRPESEHMSLSCEEMIFFSLDEEDYLRLFYGTREEGQAIRTFFQIDVPFLESSLPRDTVDQLRRGIHVKDVAEFNSVLSTFSDYSIHRHADSDDNPLKISETLWKY